MLEAHCFYESEQEITFFLRYAPLLDLQLGKAMVGVSAQWDKKLLKLQEKRTFLVLLEFRVITLEKCCVLVIQYLLSVH